MQQTMNQNEINILLNNLIEFTSFYITKAQLRQAAKIEVSDELFIFMVCAYNCYVLTHQKKFEGNYSLILNPEAIFISEEDKEAFVQILKELIMENLIDEN